MNPSQRHYDQHLASYYSWSVGGVRAAVARAARELDALGVAPSAGARVVDLGAGFGAHTLALAERGARVTAVDASAQLLDELGSFAAELAVERVSADIVEWIEHAPDQFDAVLCMGDTLTHLESPEQARRLLQAGVSRLAPGGALLTTFRDYSTAVVGSDFQVVVRSEAERIATCVIEHREAGVFVRDLLHEFVDSTWRVRSSRYVKLRLAPGEVSRWLETPGVTVTRTWSPSGMVALGAARPRVAG